MKELDLDPIFESIKPELLTEKTKETLLTLVEATVAEKSEERIQYLDEKFEEFKARESARMEAKAVKHMDETLVERLDSWLDLVATEYVKENKLAIESGLGNTLNASLIASMKKVFETHGIPVAEQSKLEKLSSKIETLTAEKDELLEKSLEYKTHAKGAKATAIFETVASDLSMNQKAKLKSLAGHLDIDDLAEFKEKLTTIKENLVERASSFREERKPSKPTKTSLQESVIEDESEDERTSADTKAPFQFRPEESANRAFENIPDMTELL